MLLSSSAAHGPAANRPRCFTAPPRPFRCFVNNTFDLMVNSFGQFERLPPDDSDEARLFYDIDTAFTAVRDQTDVSSPTSTPLSLR